MKFKWQRSRTTSSALDDLLRAIENVEARAGLRTHAPAAAVNHAVDASGRIPPERGESFDDAGPPYGRGV